LESLHRIEKTWEKQLEKKPTKNEMAANVMKLGFAGHMATIDALAKGDPLKYNEAERLPIAVALFKLTYDKEVNEYQERLYEIMKPK
tara:strand:- start:12986 stop:13246 length:261 start_codon:yes stop_codon:yes gene_type:complete